MHRNNRQLLPGDWVAGGQGGHDDQGNPCIRVPRHFFDPVLRIARYSCCPWPGNVLFTPGTGTKLQAAGAAAQFVRHRMEWKAIDGVCKAP